MTIIFFHRWNGTFPTQEQDQAITLPSWKLNTGAVTHNTGEDIMDPKLLVPLFDLFSNLQSQIVEY